MSMPARDIQSLNALLWYAPFIRATSCITRCPIRPLYAYYHIFDKRPLLRRTPTWSDNEIMTGILFFCLVVIAVPLGTVH